MTVGVPGFVCALLVSRLVDPTRTPARLTVRSFLRDFEIGVLPLLRNLLAADRWAWRSAAPRPGGSTAPTAPTRRSMSRSFSGGGGPRPRARPSCAGCSARPPTGATTRPSAAGSAARSTTSCARAGRCCTRRPWSTSSSRGAMISFGMNGIVGWGPTFVSRELELSVGRGGDAAGQVGADRGHGGHAVRRRAGRLAPPPLRDGARDRRGARAAARRAARDLAAHDSRPGAVPGRVRASRSSASRGTTAR